jgi:pantetheine-phosphate adenylyltransferase
MSKACILPGTFDPFTLGHLDLLKRASAIFDIVYIALLTNITKVPAFTAQERIDQIIAAADEEKIHNIVIEEFDGLMVEYARKVGAKHIVRGVRDTVDFEYEYKGYLLNKQLAPEIDTVYLMTKPEYSFISSTMAKEIAICSGDISGFVPKINEKIISLIAISQE